MNSSPALALLPAGLHDLLPPDAEREAALVERAMSVFRAHGYERVKPPLVEFEESLLSGVGRAWALQTFRLLDPESQRMMAIRADMTLQVARLSRSRLVKAARPLRLCYAGEVLRVGGALLSPERQFRQIGCELIGSLDAASDAEIILLASSALSRLGVRGLSIDLNLPTLMPAIFAAYGITGEAERRLAHALAHRDTAVAGAAPEVGALLSDLLDLAGPADAAIEKLGRIVLPGAAESSRARLVQTVRLIRSTDPNLTLTVDPLERQGFEYQTGLSFTIFARGSRRELGRGGRYRISGNSGAVDAATDNPGQREPAVGFSLFADAVLTATPEAPPPKRVYLPFGTSATLAAALRAGDWITVAALSPVEEFALEAKRLGCTHFLPPGSDQPRPLV
jgi:ATP phosphoribosyltransferase regulatory subunit